MAGIGNNWGGKRAGAGRKPQGAEPKQLYTIRVSKEEKQAVIQLLQQMRTGISAPTSDTLDNWCKITREKAEQDYKEYTRTYALDLYHRMDTNHPTMIKKLAYIQMYADMLGYDYVEDIVQIRNKYEANRKPTLAEIMSGGGDNA